MSGHAWLLVTTVVLWSGTAAGERRASDGLPDAAMAPRPLDRVVILSDPAGDPILPDLARARARGHAGAAGETALAFDFDSPEEPWTPAELTSLQRYVAEIYPAILAVYGPPAFAITVNIRKDSTLPPSVGANYTPAENRIRMRWVDPATLCHEMVHAFHDDDIVYLDGYEEGLAAGVEVIVGDRLGESWRWDPHHGVPDDIYYEALNQPSVGTSNGSFWAGAPLVALRYGMAGYAWDKVQLEYPDFFRDFNARYYAAMLVDEWIRVSSSGLADLVRQSAPVIEGKEARTWLSEQYVLSLDPPLGPQIFQNVGYYSAACFARATDGTETPLGGAAVSWTVRDGDGLPVADWAGASDPSGVAWHEASIPPTTSGCLHVVAEMNGPEGKVTSEAYRVAGDGVGLFGVVTDAAFGSVTIAPLDTALAPVTVPISHGAFSVPAFGPVPGRFELRLTYPEGTQVSRRVTKDSSPYFVLLSAPPGARPAPAALIARPSLTRAGARFLFARALAGPGRLDLYDVAGHRVRTLILPAGSRGADWDGTDARGTTVASGLYFARVTAAGLDARAKVAVAR